MEWIKERKVISPVPQSDWRVIPEEWATDAAKREKKLLFGNN